MSMGDAPVPMTYPQVISVPYTYTAGRAQAAFLRGLAERRIIGSRVGDQTLVPARPYAPDGRVTEELVDVATTGELRAWTTRYEHGEQRTYGMVRLDGADTDMFHLLDVPADRLDLGLRVRVRWAEESDTEITSIEAFELAED